ncbi:MAG: hypothetical protein ACK5HT_21670 [Draconibacterium sp.]
MFSAKFKGTQRSFGVLSSLIIIFFFVLYIIALGIAATNNINIANAITQASYTVPLNADVENLAA